MQRSMGRSRDMPADRSGLSGIPDAIGDAEALGIEPAHFPESLLRSPDGAEALGALAQIGLGVGDAHDDISSSLRREARIRGCQGTVSTINSIVLWRRPAPAS